MQNTLHAFETSDRDADSVRRDLSTDPLGRGGR